MHFFKRLNIKNFPVLKIKHKLFYFLNLKNLLIFKLCTSICVLFPQNNSEFCLSIQIDKLKRPFFVHQRFGAHFAPKYFVKHNKQGQQELQYQNIR